MNDSRNRGAQKSFVDPPITITRIYLHGGKTTRVRKWRNDRRINRSSSYDSEKGERKREREREKKKRKKKKKERNVK